LAAKPPLGIFGAGWVGLVTGACFAERGHQVVVRDVVAERIESLNAGRLPFHEPGLAELIERNRERLTFTLDVAELKAGTNIFFTCVDTPPTASGDANLSYVWSVIDDLGGANGRAGKAGTASSRHRERSLSGEATLVMKSTVPVGTGERIRAALDQRGLTGVGYVSNPEFLAEGRAVKDFMNPDRIVIGSFEEAAGDRVAALYEGFDAPVVRTSVASAEMIKLAANAFLATRISFINEIANVSEAVGADVAEVAYGMGLDKRIGTSYLNPGIGYGGSCFPKDVSFLKLLAGNSGYHFQLVSAVIEVNDLQKRRVVSKLQNRLGSLRGKKIALLGLAFKPNTDDMREAPSLVLASRLQAEGAVVHAWDPLVESHPALEGVVLEASLLDAVRDADAAVIVTEWPELEGLASEEVREAMRTPLIVDGRNLLDPEAARAAGFEYEGIGRVE
jgi:UDPglucose 6-dehydrogenase